MSKQLYDPTFGPTALARHFCKSDFKKFPVLNTLVGREAHLNQSVTIGRNGFNNLNFLTCNLAGRTTYRLVDFPSELVLRKAAENIRRISNTKQKDRIKIIRSLQLLCEEGMPFSLAKFDVRQFFERIDQEHLKKILNRRFSISPSTRRVLLSFMQQCQSQGITGLPRGLAISAALSELYMDDFDALVQRKLGTHFYARYIDDIIMLLPPKHEPKSLRKTVTSMLPSGLTLNHKKTRVLGFSGKKEKLLVAEHMFDHLGFSFSVSRVFCSKKNKLLCRQVTLGIAQSKIKKRKTRIVRALLQYLLDQNYFDLIDRFKILTCSYRFYDHRKGKLRLAGNYHSYGLIDPPYEALNELDMFAKNLLLSKSGKIGAPLAKTLSKAKRERLLRLSFKRGFERKTHFYFPSDRLNYLMRCWRYV